MYKKDTFYKWIRRVKHFCDMAHYKEFCSKNNGYDSFCRKQYQEYLMEV